jgi:hypothetical protein
MITIRTFLRSKDGAFQQVEACEAPPGDPDYIEGAVELSIDGVEILGRSEWDYVDQLWAYIANMIHALRTQDEASTYFPDQPILLTFERKGNRILVSSKAGEATRRASADESELFAAIGTAGREFFEKMSDLARSNSAGYQIALAKLRG